MKSFWNFSNSILSSSLRTPICSTSDNKSKILLILYTTSIVSLLISAITASERNCFASSKIGEILLILPENAISLVFINGFFSLPFIKSWAKIFVTKTIAKEYNLNFFIKLAKLY